MRLGVRGDQMRRIIAATAVAMLVASVLGSCSHPNEAKEVARWCAAIERSASSVRRPGVSYFSAIGGTTTTTVDADAVQSAAVPDAIRSDWQEAGRGSELASMRVGVWTKEHCSESAMMHLAR